MPMLAPHAADQRIADAAPGRVRLTVDADVAEESRSAGARARAHAGADARARRLPRHARRRQCHGQVNGDARLHRPLFRRRRAPAGRHDRALPLAGSTLEPFIYGSASRVVSSVQTLIETGRTVQRLHAAVFHFTFQGTVTIRRRCSSRLTCRRCGARPGGTEPAGGAARPAGAGPGAAPGARLRSRYRPRRRRYQALRSVMLYAGSRASARCCIERAQHLCVPSPAPSTRGKSETLMTPVAAWYVSNVLIGAPPAGDRRAGRIAFKTGASYGYHDAWSIVSMASTPSAYGLAGLTARRYPGLIGRAAAAPILFEAFARLLRRRRACACTYGRAGDHLRQAACRRHSSVLRRGPRPRHAAAAAHLSAGWHLARARHDRRHAKSGAAKITAPARRSPFSSTACRSWTRRRASPRASRGNFFRPQGPGFARVTVIDAAGATDSVIVRLDDGRP